VVHHSAERKVTLKSAFVPLSELVYSYICTGLVVTRTAVQDTNQSMATQTDKQINQLWEV